MKQLRRSFEKARLLVDLARKRERKKLRLVTVENEIFEAQRQRFEPEPAGDSEGRTHARTTTLVATTTDAPGVHNGKGGEEISVNVGLGKRGPQAREDAPSEARGKKRKVSGSHPRVTVMLPGSRRGSGESPPWVRHLLCNGLSRSMRQRKERAVGGKRIRIQDFDGCVATSYGDALLFRLPQISMWLTPGGMLQRKRGPIHRPRIDAKRVLLCMGMMDVYNALEQHSISDGAGQRKCSEPFLVVPSEAEAPGYRGLIKNVMDLVTIRSKVQQSKYPTSSAFCQDIQLMLRNARAYNRVDSRVYEDAAELQRVFSRQKAARPLSRGAFSQIGGQSGTDLRPLAP